MEPDYTYYAFISYRPKDEAIAKRVQHFLEHYKLPGEFRRKYAHIPPSLRPVFRDWSDLDTADIRQQLDKALSASRYLVVICTKNSARPGADGVDWADDEIRRFIAMRPENITRIIPIVYRSKDTSIPPQDYLPPAIRENAILAQDVLSHGEARALINLAAKMSGLAADALWDRRQRDARRRRRARWLLGGFIAACAAALGWYCWDYYTPHISYYTDYIERGNMPEGLYELSEEQAGTSHRHYRFTTHKRRLRSVEYCNALGEPQEHSTPWRLERTAGMELLYDENGTVRQCLHRNAQGKELFSRSFGESTIDIVSSAHEGNNWHQIAGFVSIVTGVGQESISSSRTLVGRFYVERQPEGANRGVVVREIFCHAGRLEPAAGAQGVAGREYRLDELGRPTEVRFLAVRSTSALNAKPEPTETREGIAGYRFRYDARGHVAAFAFFDREGKTVRNAEAWSEIHLTYDSQGNPVKQSYLAPDGTPTLHRDGYASMACLYDSWGNRVEEAYYGLDGHPCLHSKGYTAKRMMYDVRGRLVQETHLGADGKPCLNTDGYAVRTRRHDEAGNIAEEAYYGVDGKPCRNLRGYARVTFLYDALGNLAEEAYFGPDGKPCTDLDACAKLTYRYDERGNRTEEAYFAPDGAPTLHCDGYARLRCSYDKRGNCVEWCFFGTDGHHCLHKDGFARVTFRYDKRGNCVETAFYGVDGKPHANRHGYARAVTEHDERGTPVKPRFWDEQMREIEVK